MNVLRLIFNLPMLAANVVAALLWIVSAYSDRISPDTSILFSYLGMAFPLFCLVNFCFILYWIFLTHWKCLLLNLGVMAICWVPLTNYFPFHLEREIPQGTTLKVLTYNVMGFAGKNHTDEAPNPILSYIAHTDADIVCLQEYHAAKSGKHLTEAKVFKALHSYPHHATVYLGNSKHSGSGIAVFSKYPIKQSRRIDYPSEGNGSAIHEIQIKDKRLTLINNHLESFKLTSEDRSRYSDFIKTPNSENFDDLRGSVQQKLGTAFRIRAKQAETLAKEIQQIDSDYILVCGDFNDTPISYAHHTIQGNLSDAFSKAGNGMGITYNQNFFWFKIDHILHSKNLEALHCQVDKVTYSDHYPVWCIFRLK